MNTTFNTYAINAKTSPRRATQTQKFGAAFLRVDRIGEDIQQRFRFRMLPGDANQYPALAPPDPNKAKTGWDFTIYSINTERSKNGQIWIHWGDTDGNHYKMPDKLETWTAVSQLIEATALSIPDTDRQSLLEVVDAMISQANATATTKEG